MHLVATHIVLQPHHAVTIAITH